MTPFRRRATSPPTPPTPTAPGRPSASELVQGYARVFGLQPWKDELIEQWKAALDKEHQPTRGDKQARLDEVGKSRFRALGRVLRSAGATYEMTVENHARIQLPVEIGDNSQARALFLRSVAATLLADDYRVGDATHHRDLMTGDIELFSGFDSDINYPKAGSELFGEAAAANTADLDQVLSGKTISNNFADGTGGQPAFG